MQGFRRLRFGCYTSLASAALTGCMSLLDIDGFEYGDGAGGATTATGQGGASTSAQSSAAIGGAATVGGGGGAGPSAGGGGGMPVGSFVDDFNRPDGVPIGNGWIEKEPAIYSLLGGQVQKEPSMTGYRQNMVYRPASEDVLDVEASIHFSFGNAMPDFPQVFVRAQAATIADPDAFDAYKITIGGNVSNAWISRQTGATNSLHLDTFTLVQPMVPGDNYRLRVRVEGTNPVQLSAWVEHEVGSNFEIIGQSAVDDMSPERIDNAGSVGFSANNSGDYVYDMFERTVL